MRYALSVVLLVVACAHTPPVESAAPGWKLLNATAGTDELQIRGEQGLRRAAVTDTSVRGPVLDLKRVPGKLQGTSYGDRPVDMQQRGNGIAGRVGSDSWDLTLEQDGNEMRATGQIGGHPSTFWMSPPKIRGGVGPCTFELVWSAGNYAGTRSCGPDSDVIQLQFPAVLASWSDPEVAALLAIFVQRN
ncbi:MAG: hypothetical protein ACXWK5_01750 [Myxococcaceae bacterium]